MLNWLLAWHPPGHIMPCFLGRLISHGADTAALLLPLDSFNTCRWQLLQLPLWWQPQSFTAVSELWQPGTHLTPTHAALPVQAFLQPNSNMFMCSQVLTRQQCRHTQLMADVAWGPEIVGWLFAHPGLMLLGMLLLLLLAPGVCCPHSNLTVNETGELLPLDGSAPGTKAGEVTVTASCPKAPNYTEPGYSAICKHDNTSNLQVGKARLRLLPLRCPAERATPGRRPSCLACRDSAGLGVCGCMQLCSCRLACILGGPAPDCGHSEAVRARDAVQS